MAFEKIEVTISLEEIAESIRLLGWSYRGLADMLGVPEKRVRSGKLDQQAVEVLRVRAAHAKENPFPVAEASRFLAARQRRAADRRFRENREAAESAHQPVG